MTQINHKILQPDNIRIIKSQPLSRFLNLYRRSCISQQNLNGITRHEIHECKNQNGNHDQNRNHLKQSLSNIFPHMLYHLSKNFCCSPEYAERYIILAVIFSSSPFSDFFRFSIGLIVAYRRFSSIFNFFPGAYFAGKPKNEAHSKFEGVLCFFNSPGVIPSYFFMARVSAWLSQKPDMRTTSLTLYCTSSSFAFSTRSR